MVMITATSLTTLMDTIASDAAKTSNAISFMTLYSVVLDFGAASGPLLAFFILTFHNGVHYIYLGGAVIFLFICGLWVKQYK
jgi:MFS family permease